MSRTPLSLQNALRDTLKEFGLDKKARDYQVLVNWEEIVGEKIASVSSPEKLEHGTLIVKVMEPVWRSELTARTLQILAKVQHAYPGIVKDIRWKM